MSLCMKIRTTLWFPQNIEKIKISPSHRNSRTACKSVSRWDDEFWYAQYFIDIYTCACTLYTYMYITTSRSIIARDIAIDDVSISPSLTNQYCKITCRYIFSIDSEECQILHQSHALFHSSCTSLTKGEATHWQSVGRWWPVVPVRTRDDGATTPRGTSWGPWRWPWRRHRAQRDDTVTIPRHSIDTAMWAA